MPEWNVEERPWTDLSLNKPGVTVAVVARKRISQHLSRQAEILTDRQIGAVYDAARRSTTWT